MKLTLALRCYNRSPQPRFCSHVAANPAACICKHFAQLARTRRSPSDLEDSAWFLFEVSRVFSYHVLCVMSYCVLISGLCRNEVPAVTLETLHSLASVRRFDMAVMFMSSTEKKGRVSLWCATWPLSICSTTLYNLLVLMCCLSSPQWWQNCLISFTKLSWMDQMSRPYRGNTECDAWIEKIHRL